MSLQISDDVKWYGKKRHDYEEFANRVSKILTEILNLEKTNYAIIEARAKSLESFQSKLNEIDYGGKEIQDLAGVRVVGYVRSDVDKIEEIIRKNFVVDQERTKDKAAELSPDKVGYRAIHLVCTLPDERTVLPEYKKFENMIVEIQVKTMLEHTWAEIEHDRNYKYKGLPDNIQRDFYLIAASLEVADKQIEEITKRIERYVKEIKEKTEQGKLQEISINPLTLKRYLIDKFPEKVHFDHSYGFGGSGKKEVKELHTMGIKNMSDLENIIPQNLIEIMKNAGELDVANLTSLVFATLIIKFEQKYFEIAKETREYSKKGFQNSLDKYKQSFEKTKH